MRTKLRGSGLALTAVIAIGCGEGDLDQLEPETVSARATALTAVSMLLWNATFTDAAGWNAAGKYDTFGHPDINGDGRDDVCGRGATGLRCAVSNSGAFVGTRTWGARFSDADGYAGASSYLTIGYPDINGDGRADACGRKSTGVHCFLSNGTGFATSVSVPTPGFTDSAGAARVGSYNTIDYPDVNGDGRADVCGRMGGGVHCQLSGGTTLGAPLLWSSVFSDNNGWRQDRYHATIRFPDIDGDGKADVCGRGPTGVRCALSDGNKFGTVTLWQGTLSDANGWNVIGSYATIRFPDVNGDGKADLCGRGPAGVSCALSNGATGFGSFTLWDSSFSDAAGWNQASYYGTISFPDLDGDDRADLCGRGPTGVHCATSNGLNLFLGMAPRSTAQSDANGWTAPEYYKTIAFPDVDDDGKADLCARSVSGMTCENDLEARPDPLVPLLMAAIGETTCAVFEDPGARRSLRCSGVTPGAKTYTPIVLESWRSGSSREMIHLAGGWGHHCGVRRNGSVACWGNGDHGKLGVGLGNRTIPTTVPNLPAATQVAAGADHTCALLTNGTLMCWGSNASGQLGVSGAGDRLTPVQVTTIPGQIVSEIASGMLSMATVARVGGVVWTTGPGGFSVLQGLPPIATQVAAGSQHACARLTDGSVWCWGRDDWGQIGDGMAGAVNTAPIFAITHAVAPLGAVDIAAGDASSFAVVMENVGGVPTRVLRSWGRNATPTPGEGGIGASGITGRATPGVVPTVAPVKVLGGYDMGCIIEANRMRCFGFNKSGQLGNYATLGDSVAPVEVIPHPPFTNAKP